MKSQSKHWDKIFLNTENSKLGWYEKDVSKTLELLDQIPNWKDSTLFIPGTGTSLLVDELLAFDVKLVLNDISAEALSLIKNRLDPLSDRIFWLCQNIALPIPNGTPDIDIWIDRAVLHFLTDENDISGYFRNVESKIKVGGYALFAEYSKTGVAKCAGLPLHQYSIKEISEKLGPSFSLQSHFNYTYINPGGDPRPYIYALYKRIS